MNNNYSYKSYDNDRLIEGKKLLIEHTVYLKGDYNITDHISQPIDKLEAEYNKNIKIENDIFKKICNSVTEWEEQAAKTRLIYRAIEYLKTPECTHTSNMLVNKGYEHEISNRVYKMNYHVREDQKYNIQTKQNETIAWVVNWSICLNTPYSNHYNQIYGQINRRFYDKEKMQKYIDGRIKEYSYLFKEISPIIPKEYKDNFCVNGYLLPNYRIEGEAEKESVKEKISIMDQLKKIAQINKTESVKEKVKENKVIESVK